MMSKEQLERRLTRANPVAHPEHLHQDSAETNALLSLILERRDDMTLTQQPQQTRPPTQPRWRPARIAVATAVLVILVVGAVALGVRGGEDQATVPSTVATTLPEPATTLPAAPTTALPAGTVPDTEPGTLLAGTWLHETASEPFPGYEVTETSLGFFSVEDGSGVWFSADGTDFQQVLAMPVGEVIEDAELQPGIPPIYSISASVKTIVEYADAVYAFAEIADPAHGPEWAVRQLAYRTTDGTGFEEIEYASEEGFPIPLVGGEAMVVILEGSEPSTPIYRTEDGTAWMRHDPGLNVRSAVVFEDDFLVLDRSYIGTDDPDGRFALYRSGNGIEWTRIEGSEFKAGEEYPDELIAHDGRLYASGAVFDGERARGAIFHSADGAGWSRADLLEDYDLRVVDHLVSTKFGLLALGREGYQSVSLIPLTTIDGTTFVEIPHPEGMFDGSWPWGYATTDGFELLGDQPGGYSRWTWTAAD